MMSNTQGPISRMAILPLIGFIRFYRYTLSAFMGRTCRYLPTCSEYAEEALVRHGAWAGGWVGFARLCRCRPGGASGLDFVCEALPGDGRWYLPWRYGLWRGTNPVAPKSSARKPSA